MMKKPFRSQSAVFLAVTLAVIVSFFIRVEAAEQQRNAFAIKNAFRDVVADASRSTVRILCDDRRTSFGVIVDANGYILTKASELSGEVTCQILGRDTMPARIVAVDDQWDLALLKVDASDLTPIKWSDEPPPVVGSWLATPGLDALPIAIGVVSVGPREIERRMPALGIVLDNSEHGPRILRVLDDSGAAKAGVKEGDVVRDLDGKAMDSRETLIEAIRQYSPGDKVRLTIRRGEQTLKIEATLGEFNSMVHGNREEFQNTLGGQLSQRRAGFPLALQHDTVLTPSQCGGPIVDLEGRAVGVNIARASRVGSYALPASAIRPLLEQMKGGTMVTTTVAD
ncbi:MAG: PDZ domain-containing protein [Planctomycetaceae bacterium]|nr:MAG: PDZ domain-containing protein [Planctomycetaceae bacterium]